MLPGSTIQLRESFRMQVKHHKANERNNHKKHAIRSYVLPVTEMKVSELSTPSVQLGASVWAAEAFVLQRCLMEMQRQCHCAYGALPEWYWQGKAERNLL